MESESGVRMLETGLRCVTAPNPSPMTAQGTNTYLLGEGEVAVIDPGPAIPSHLDAIMGALAPGERIGAILVTHSHRDHSPLAQSLAQKTGAPIMAAGPSNWGRSATMAALATAGAVGGGEGVDPDFDPDQRIGDGEVIAGPWGEIAVLHTPGHMANHLSFAWQGALFTGDLVMGWSTSLVSPPDGDMGAFMRSCARLLGRDDRVYFPGHGAAVDAPQARVQTLIAHRLHREAQIIAALGTRPGATASALAHTIYTDLAPALLPAAARNVLAHLIDLSERNLAAPVGALTADAPFALR
jgi:glyoxylase-like metal-dependent hydrolase (beta-lactamase superfamily II)